METHNHPNNIENFTRKIIKEIPLESPSQNFTKNILSKIETQKSSKISYSPLITWKSWTIAAILLLGLFFIPTEKSENSMLNKVSVDFSVSEWLNKLPSFDGFSASSTTVFAFVLFAIMVSVQAFYLRGYFDKRYKL